MEQLGIGVILSAMKGRGQGEIDRYVQSLGKVIRDITVSESACDITFDDDSCIQFYDDGQSCCESRYMRTDDDLPYYSGARLVNVDLADGPDVPDEYCTHETQFLKIITDRGTITVCSHNEHNGYYGGFSIRVK